MGFGGFTRAQFAIAAAVLMFAAFALFGCAGNADANGGRKIIKVSGAFALYPLMVKWAQEYQALHPDVRIDVSAGGAGKGMTDTLSGVVDIGMVSREIDAAEIAKGAFPIAVATDAVVLIANAENPSAAKIAQDGIAKEKLEMIYIDGFEVTWAEIAGGSDAPVTVFTRSDSCGAADTFSKYLGGKQEDLRGVGVFGDPGIVEAVSNQKNGIGYANLNFAYDMKTGKIADGIIPVPLEGTDARIYLSKAALVSAIAAKKYPSPPARDLYIVGRDGFDGESAKFVQWILNDGQAFVDEAGYVRLDDAALSAQRVKFGGA